MEGFRGKSVVVGDEEHTSEFFEAEDVPGESHVHRAPAARRRSHTPCFGFTHLDRSALTFIMADDTAFDVVVLGTGLTESIAAA